MTEPNSDLAEDIRRWKASQQARAVRSRVVRTCTGCPMDGSCHTACDRFRAALEEVPRE